MIEQIRIEPRDTIREITNRMIREGARFQHVAWTRGYISRRSAGWIEPYAGRYGRGYVWHTPSKISTRYHHVEYWIFDR